LGHAPYWPLYRSLISLGRCGNGVELVDPHVGETSEAGSGRKPQKKLAWGQVLAFGAGFDADENGKSRFRSEKPVKSLRIDGKKRMLGMLAPGWPLNFRTSAFRAAICADELRLDCSRVSLFSGLLQE